MITRQVPVRRYGNEPQLDHLIEHQPSAKSNRRCKVGQRYFHNLSLAREEVQRLIDLQVGHDLYYFIKYELNQRKKSHQGDTWTRQSKQHARLIKMMSSILNNHC